MRPIATSNVFPILALLALTSGSACGSAPSVSAPGSTLESRSADPVRSGWSSSGLERSRLDARRLGAVALLVVTDGEPVLWFGDLTRPLRAHSIRKSLLSALFGIAIDEGRIDLRETLAGLGIDETTTPLTEEEKRATVADLLASRSGIYLPAASEVPSAQEARPERYRDAPGERWVYANWGFNALGTIYRSRTGEDVFEAFERRIAIPIGMQDFDLEDTRYQLEEVSRHPSYKFRISTRDLARFGSLYLRGGEWDGTQVLPREWVEASTRAHSITGRRGTKSGYGWMWWVAAPVDASRSTIPDGAFTASGTGGHRLTVLPSISTVVVFRTDTDDPEAPRVGSSAYDRFLTGLLEARTEP